MHILRPIKLGFHLTSLHFVGVRELKKAQLSFVTKARKNSARMAMLRLGFVARSKLSINARFACFSITCFNAYGRSG